LRIRESPNTQSPGLRFRAVMPEGATQMNFHSERFDRLGEVSAWRWGSPRGHQHDGHPQPASIQLLHTRSSGPFSGVCRSARRLWKTNGLRTSEDGGVMEAREHEPTLERVQETGLGHRSSVAGVRQVHVGISDSVDHAPVGTQQATSKLAHVHADYDGQLCLDRALDLLPYLLASLTCIRRSSPSCLQPGRSKHLSELARRRTE
jgi:hypothetical protein